MSFVSQSITATASKITKKIIGARYFFPSFISSPLQMADSVLFHYTPRGLRFLLRVQLLGWNVSLWAWYNQFNKSEFSKKRVALWKKQSTYYQQVCSSWWCLWWYPVVRMSIQQILRKATLIFILLQKFQELSIGIRFLLCE